MSRATPPGIVIAAASSGSGKTVVTLGLLRHFLNVGIKAASAKIGPDYIDPAFHAAAGGGQCITLDPWAMAADQLGAALSMVSVDRDVLIAEGVMGLFDGATAQSGSTADIAAVMGWPIVLVLDVRAQAASAAAIVRGFATHRPGIRIAGVIFNRVGSERHEKVLRDAMADSGLDIPILGMLPCIEGLALPERHLGLVQAVEHPTLERFLDQSAEVMARHVDTDQLLALAKPSKLAVGGAVAATLPPPPLGQRIAVAKDAAFMFAYPHFLHGWRQAGAELSFFSPLADEAPAADVDAVYLPGGYPELYAEALSQASVFLRGVTAAAARGGAVFGECGGYMVLGRGIVDASGRRHAMCELLPLETSFADRKLHLGYRRAKLLSDTPLGRKDSVLRGHEFHYATVSEEGPGEALLQTEAADGAALGACGLRVGNVMGSFVHIIAAETQGGRNGRS